MGRLVPHVSPPRPPVTLRDPDSAQEFYGDTLEGLATNAQATLVGGRYASTVDGTAADALMPLYGPIRSARWSFVVKADKTGTALNRSTVGFTAGLEPGTFPTGGFPTGAAIGVGYLQGTGIAAVFDNLSTPTVVVADANLTNGQEYVVECGWDNDFSQGLPFGHGGYFGVTVRNLTTGALVGSGVVLTSVGWGLPGSFLIRTNAAAGNIRRVAFKAHAFGALRRNPPLRSTLTTYQTIELQSIHFRTPAVPLRPYRVAIWCHGFGQATPFSITAGVVELPLIEALDRAGIITVIPNLHGNVWGNEEALADLSDLRQDIVARLGEEVEFFLIGESMGALAAANAVAERLFPVRAVAIVDGVLDTAWAAAQGSFSASVAAAYPGGATQYRNPMTYDPGRYGDVPFWVSASADDTAVSKAANATAFATRLGPQVTVVNTTGAHVAASHFSTPAALVNFLLSA